MKAYCFNPKKSEEDKFEYTTSGVLEISFSDIPKYGCDGNPIEVEVPDCLKDLKFSDPSCQKLREVGCSGGLFRYKDYFYVKSGTSFFFPISKDPADYSEIGAELFLEYKAQMKIIKVKRIKS